MFKVFDPLLDYNCPYCEKSLRWKIVSTKFQTENNKPVTPYLCPLCHKPIVETRHPALANHWLWSRFYLPGIVLCASGIFIPSMGWLLPFAVVALFAGCLALIVYMIKERLGWKVYIPFNDDLSMLPD